MCFILRNSLIKINKKGKEYNYYGKLKFEGEYLNGKINGKVNYIIILMVNCHLKVNI